MKFLIIVLYSFLVASFSFIQSAQALTKVLILGDSLTAGYGIEKSAAYPALIQDRADKEGLKYEILNAGMSGDTSSGALRRLPWLLKSNFDVCLIAIGANDGLRGLPVSLLKENLSKIVEKIRERNPKMRIIIAGMKLPGNFGEPYRTEFEKVFKLVSQEQATEYYAFLLEGVANDSKYNLEDRMHPSEVGHSLIAENLWPVLIRN